MDIKKLSDIWAVPKYLPYIQPDLNPATITKAENKIGFELPKAYKDLLKIQNGGYIRYTFADTPHSVITGIGPYYPSITNFEWLSEYDDLSFEVKNLFPFDGDGHWNLCLDYRVEKENPQITYIDTETDWQAVVAQSFVHYLEKLKRKYDHDFVITSELSTEDLLSKMSDCLDIKFNESKPMDVAYRLYIGKYKNSWLQIIPNEVPEGFVRENHERYFELKPQMEKLALMYPEFPAGSHLMNFSNNHLTNLPNKIVEEEMIKILTENGLQITALEGLDA